VFALCFRSKALTGIWPPFFLKLLALNSKPLFGETRYKCNSTAEQLPPQSYKFPKDMSQLDHQECILPQL
jgi:hypothetical protein